MPEFLFFLAKQVEHKWSGGSERLKKLEQRQTELEAIVKVQQRQIEQLVKGIQTNNPHLTTEKQCLNYQASAKTIKKGDGSLPKGQYSV